MPALSRRAPWSVSHPGKRRKGRQRAGGANARHASADLPMLFAILRLPGGKALAASPQALPRRQRRHSAGEAALGVPSATSPAAPRAGPGPSYQAPSLFAGRRVAVRLRRDAARAANSEDRSPGTSSSTPKAQKHAALVHHLPCRQARGAAASRRGPPPCTRSCVFRSVMSHFALFFRPSTKDVYPQTRDMYGTYICLFVDTYRIVYSRYRVLAFV